MNPTNTKPLWLFISDAMRALENCTASGNDYADIWRDRLEQAARDLLPSGSGFDNGTQIDFEESRAGRVVLKTAFHHMTEAGFYDGWTYHAIILTPAFGSPALRVMGRDRNGIKEYIAEAVGAALDARVGYVPDPRDPDGLRVSSAPEIDRETVAENAACLWEAVLEADPTGDADGWKGAMRREAQTVGIAALRSATVALAQAGEIGWREAQRTGFDSPFDWEFCPWFIAACVDWEHGPTLVPDWLDRCRDMGRADGEPV